MITADRSLWFLLLLSTKLPETRSWSETSRDCAPSESNFERSSGSRVSETEDDLAPTLLEELESRLSRLERRLRAVEQPVWQMGVTEEDWETCAEGPCRCQPEMKTVSCWRQELLDLPAAQLRSGWESIDGTPQGYVPGYDSTESLVSKDTIDTPWNSSHLEGFRSLDRFRDLSDNSIEHLPLNLFFSLHAVTHVRLSKNMLRELHRSQFLNMRNLRILDASSNRLRTLPDSLFLSTTSMMMLDLSCNRITSLASGTFHGLTTLEELLLGKNRLSTLAIDLFSDLVNLKFLRLEENRLKDLPDEVFRSQTSLRELNARGNQLATISDGLLLPLQQLQSLEMSNNKITRIDPSAFQGLLALEELQLGHNQIQTLTPGLFSTTGSLKRLVIYSNGIEILSRGVFRGLTNLTSLFLHSNHLRILHPELFQDTPNLRKLQLESNYLSSLPPRILDPVPHIEQLRLARNPWHCDCAASYLATWLQKKYLACTNGSSDATENVGAWEFGAGAICRGPGTLGGKSLMHLTFHELCEGQWASMRGLAPRIPVDHVGGNSGQPPGPPGPPHDFPSKDSVSGQ
ncbi:platelet glycoprotein V-like isoform X1 [Hylaeus anthracinus]|uniref:platelet glycoprotein V-like isoform X1 n=1 Tax=Hylaeus anthracinus TaxID=313031 RepID=UPI0023B9E8B5|nr:platelet glycoprotein V-like isoform X1 [Hylaeus anthracinus]